MISRGACAYIMKKIRMQKDDRIDFLWDKYILECRLQGYSETTLRNKEYYFSVFYRYLGESGRASLLTKGVCVSFLEARLKEVIKNISINSCNRVINSFLSWLYQNRYLPEEIKIHKLKEQEIVKPTYSEEDLKILLEKPDTTSFAEFRTWVIINYILGTGNRQASVLNIKNCDVELAEGYINLTHTKNKKKQIVPLSSSLCLLLQEYVSIRQGEPDDYLFCNSYGGKLGARSADDALTKYCNDRNVICLGHHAFRHTFAKIAVRDCNIDAFRLQRMLGHSDIKTTEHYVNLYSADLLKNRDSFNPLEHLLQDNNKNMKKIELPKGKKK